MSIIGLVGPICSGKTTLCKMLEESKGYRVIDFDQTEDIFAASQKIYNTWSTPTIVSPIKARSQLKVLQKRNYFHLVYLDAPVYVRYRRYLQKHKEITYEQFIDLDDQQKFTNTHQELVKICKVHLKNNFYSLVELQNYINQQINYVIRPFRPNWDVYFMKIAYTVKQRSNCMKKSVGAVLVDQHGRILSTSYNGTPKVMKNCNEGGCVVCKESDSLDLILYKCLCIHAEEGCILEKGVTHTRGTTLYTTLFPCVWCCKALYQAGVARIVYGEQGNWDLAIEFLGNQIKHEKVGIEQFIY